MYAYLFIRKRKDFLSPEKIEKYYFLFSICQIFSQGGSLDLAQDHIHRLWCPSYEHALMHLLSHENRFIRENWSSVKGLVPWSIRIPCALIFSTSPSVSDRSPLPFFFFYKKRFSRESNANTIKLNCQTAV